MSLPNPKELAKLAATCRKAGITHFKQGDLEFTLGAEGQSKVVKNSPKQTGNTPDPISEDTMTDEQMLYWSAADVMGKSEGAA